jgi:hypothetical protein
MGTDLQNETPPDYRRDRWGRPLVKGKPYTRSSAAAKVLEDTYNLEAWQRRNIAYGLAKDASLVARVLALGGDPGTWGKTERARIQEVIDDANKIAQSHRRADIGTALHRMMELVDAGQSIDAGPYQADVDAYVAARESMGLVPIPQYIECKMVCHALELAGSVDNIYGHHGGYVIGDKKTGSSVEFAVLSHAAQLAAYAHGELWDVTKDAPMPTPTIDTSTGYIVHVPAGEGRCDIYAVDLHEGYRAAELAVQVRTIRKASKSWSKKALAPTAPATAAVEQTPEVDPARPTSGENATTDPPPESVGGQSAGSDVVADVVDPALELANSIADWGGPLKAMLAAEWPSGVPTPGKVRKGEATWTPEQLVRAQAAINEIVGPFPETVGALQPLRTVTTTGHEGTVEHNGPIVADDVLDELLATIKGSPVRSIVNGWLSEASAAGVSWQPRITRRLRQVEIARAAYSLASIIADAPDDATDADFVELVQHIIATNAAGMTDVDMTQPIGVLLGALTIGEAHAVSGAAQALIEGRSLITFSDQGRVVLTDSAAIPAA